MRISREFFLCSEDQWDIYKLDPAYECFVPAAPDHPTVMRKEPSFDHMSINQPTRGSTLHTNSKKRRAFSPSGEEEPATVPKKFRTVRDERGTEIEEEITSSDEEGEVEEIVVDEDGHERPKPSKQYVDRAAQRRRERGESGREKRNRPPVSKPSSEAPPRQKTPEIVDLTMEDSSSSQESSVDPSPEPTPLNDITATGTTKRKRE